MKKFALILLTLTLLACGQGYETSSRSSEVPTSSGSPVCVAGTHVEAGVCISDVRSCTVVNGSGQETWNGAGYGACTVVMCNSGYRNQSNVCVFSPNSCPIANGNGQTQQSGQCQLVSCNSGYHANGNMCESNQRTCAISNGTGSQTWNGTAFGVCMVATCNTGFTNQSNACVFSPMSCPIANGSGQSQQSGQCQLVSCNSGYHANGNVCESNQRACAITNGTGSQTWNGTAFGACTVVSCNTGYTQSGSTCVANNPNPGGNPAWVPRNSARVFLSGHSLTDDPLAEYVGDIAQKRGDSYNYNEQIVIGSPIRVRTRGGSSTGWAGYSTGKNRNGSSGLNVISELRNPQTIGAGQRYDTLVLAENHNSLDMIQWESTVQYTRHYHDRVIEGNPAARTLFYNTWLGLNKNAPAQWIDHEKKALITWECAVSKVNLSLQASGRSDRVINLPTGAGLAHLAERALADQVPGITGSTVQKMNMIFGDDVHLTQLGIYYMALLTYSATYGKAPTGVTPPAGINSATATELQRVAWDYINAYYNRPNPGQREMSECRIHVEQQFCSAYWTLKNMGGSIPGCQSFWGGAQSPFRWPDSSFTVLPAP